MEVFQQLHPPRKTSVLFTSRDFTVDHFQEFLGKHPHVLLPGSSPVGAYLGRVALPLFYQIWDFCLQTLAELKYWLFVKYKNMSSVLKSVPLKYSLTAKKKKRAWKISPHQGIKVKISSNKTNGNHGPLIRGIEKDTASLWWCSCQVPRTWISSWENTSKTDWEPFYKLTGLSSSKMSSHETQGKLRECSRWKETKETWWQKVVCDSKLAPLLLKKKVRINVKL